MPNNYVYKLTLGKATNKIERFELISRTEHTVTVAYNIIDGSRIEIREKTSTSNHIYIDTITEAVRFAKEQCAGVIRNCELKIDLCKARIEELDKITADINI